MAVKRPVSCSIAVESRLSVTDQICKQILSELEGNGFSQDDIFAVHLAVGEAFLNAVKHGNKMDSAKKVKIDYSVGSDRFEVSITDEGDGFDPESVPDPRVGENLYMPEGRGLLLMRSYMDVVKFNERGNSVYMARFKEKPSLSKNSVQN